MKKIILFFLIFCLFLQCKKESKITNDQMKVIKDALGRNVEIPVEVNQVICSGSGCLRLLSYLQGLDKVVAVDSIEKKENQFDARPYALANPQLKNLPLFGEFRGLDNPELIISLDKQPQVIFKTYSTSGYDPEELQNKTGIPVIVLNYGDLGANRDSFFQALTIMAKVIDRKQRALEVIHFFKKEMEELRQRTADISEQNKKSCYIGGIAYRGPHGMQSTEPAYPPFKMINANNVAFNPQKAIKEQVHADIAKESLLKWDPQILFIDLSTLQSDIKVNALYELRNDPVYQQLTAVQRGEIYYLLPYNWYTRNFGSILANAWYIGKVLYPEKFGDLDPAEKADQIYTFLVGKAVFQEMNQQFQQQVFTKAKK
ncbi:MAG: iron ABC transporter substrate-binding protein [Spirochaetes bacterium]|nr:iron ABC transporter substrate-binding protein [Spirochaetota bacterium]